MFNKIIGLGESSPVKSYYPELRKRLKELEKFRFLMDGIHDFIAVFEFGPDGHLADCNKAFRNMTGMDEDSAEEYRLNSFIKFAKGQDIHWEEHKFDEHTAATYTGQLAVSKDKALPVEFSMAPMIFDEKRYLVFIGRDISERIEKENTLKRLNSMLEKKLDDVVQEKLAHQEIMIKQSRMAAMGEMIGNIAHQWRQPLCALSLFIQDIAEEYESGGLSKEYLDKITEDSLKQISFMSQTIDNFRNYYRPDKEKVNLDISKLINDTVSIIEKQLEANSIELQLYITSTDESLFAFGYENEFKHVVLNLINNSIDAVMEAIRSGKTEHGLIEVYVRDKGRHIYIQIKDNGGGIPEDTIHKIFEPYFTTKEEGKGTGIGLYMSKMIVENNMGGRLRAVNTDDGSAVFEIKLKKSGL